MSVSKPLDLKQSAPLKLFIYATDNASTVFALARDEEEAEKKIRKTESGRDKILTKRYEISKNEVVFSHDTVAVEKHNEQSGPIPIPIQDEKTTATVNNSAGIRRFYFNRKEDISGVSGTGKVAEGVVYSDGKCSIRWFGEHSSTNNYESLEDMIAIHGHNGSTEVVFYDN